MFLNALNDYSKNGGKGRNGQEDNTGALGRRSIDFRTKEAVLLLRFWERQKTL